MRCICSVVSAWASRTTATGFPRYAALVNTSTCLNGTDNIVGAFAWGMPVCHNGHVLDLGSVQDVTRPAPRRFILACMEHRDPPPTESESQSRRPLSIVE